tara:strand:+ start:176 stop:724 length:549 start_codon:yes stop_codon:yes gene_type:complete
MNNAVLNFFVLMAVGILIRFQFNPNGALWGYGIMTIALAGIVLQLTILKGLEENKKDLGLVKSFKVLITNVIGAQFPSFLLLISLIWIYTIYLKHDDIIKSGNTPKQFNEFTSLSLTIIVIQMALLYFSLSTPTKIAGMPIPVNILKAVKGSLNSFMALITIINWFLIGIMYIIMEHFRTDG